MKTLASLLPHIMLFRTIGPRSHWPLIQMAWRFPKNVQSSTKATATPMATPRSFPTKTQLPIVARPSLQPAPVSHPANRQLETASESLTLIATARAPAVISKRQSETSTLYWNALMAVPLHRFLNTQRRTVSSSSDPPGMHSIRLPSSTQSDTNHVRGPEAGKSQAATVEFTKVNPEIRTPSAARTSPRITVRSGPDPTSLTPGPISNCAPGLR